MTGNRFASAPISRWRELAPPPSSAYTAPDRLLADVVVVGLGAPGLLAAALLAERGVKVLGVDAGSPGRGAAGANGGFLLAGGSWFLHDAIERWGKERSLALWDASVSEFDTELDELDPAVIGMRRCGSLRVAGHPFLVGAAAEQLRDMERSDLEDHAAALTQHGVDFDRCELGGSPALLVRTDGWVDPARRVNAYAARAVTAGARLLERTRVRAVRPGVVELEGAVVHCSYVLVCVDGHLEDLVHTAPVRTNRLQMLATTTSTGGRFPIPTYMRFGRDYVIDTDPALHGAGLALGGLRDRFEASQTAQAFTGPASPSEELQADLTELATGLTGGPVNVCTRWAASVGYTEDGWPFVAETAPGVFVSGGLNGHGNLVGPLAARSIALSLAGDDRERSAGLDVLAWLAR